MSQETSPTIPLDGRGDLEYLLQGFKQHHERLENRYSKFLSALNANLPQNIEGLTILPTQNPAKIIIQFAGKEIEFSFSSLLTHGDSNSLKGRIYCRLLTSASHDTPEIIGKIDFDLSGNTQFVFSGALRTIPVSLPEDSYWLGLHFIKEALMEREA